MLKFPGNFLWGAALSSYQAEGNNFNSDWWEWEKRTGLKDLSGQACRHYQLFSEDFDIAKSLNHNTHRLSLEWSRIEPQEGEFDQEEIKHYQEVLSALRSRGIKPVVTLYHFTLPLWLAQKGGWLNKEAPLYYLRFVEKVVRAFSRDITYWITINEPLVYIYHAYLLGAWPPQKKSLFNAWTVENRFLLSHIKAYRSIHKIYQDLRLDHPKVSISQNLQAFITCKDNFLNRIAINLRDWSYNYSFLDKLARHKTLDFIGVNYYGRTIVDVRGFSLKRLLLDTCQDNHLPVKKNSLGWDIYPEGLYSLLLSLKRYNLDILITENGICTEDDNLRWEFISEHLKNVNKALAQGVKVIGYLYWSLTDNFEWDKGFAPRFGLVHIDYENYKRTVRESAKKLSEVYKAGVLNGSTE